MPESARISCIIPTYNRAGYLRAAIESTLRQSLAPVEVIVVDDGSTDDTEEVVAAFEASVRYIRQQNQGPSAARNRGAREAKGDYLAFLDSDDLWLRDKLALQYATIADDPGVGIVGGGCRYVNSEGEQIGEPQLGDPVVPPDYLAISPAIPGSSSNVLIRREAFEAVGGFDEGMSRAEDKDLWYRISRTYVVRNVMEVTVEIRVHAGERPNTGFELVRECRMRTNAKIPAGRLRRKADAWMYYHFFRLRIGERQWPAALSWLGRSFLTWPLPISRKHRRARGAVSTMVRALRG